MYTHYEMSCHAPYKSVHTIYCTILLQPESCLRGGTGTGGVEGGGQREGMSMHTHKRGEPCRAIELKRSLSPSGLVL
jgi:hypothetical protein